MRVPVAKEHSSENVPLSPVLQSRALVSDGNVLATRKIVVDIIDFERYFSEYILVCDICTSSVPTAD